MARHNRSRSGGLTRYPALDGLRGLAVLVVVAFHFLPRLVPAGSYGVTIFFVLSGFLITRILVDEIDRTGHLRFRTFYGRRALRLLPPLLIVIAAYVAIGGDFIRAIPTLFYYYNYSGQSSRYMLHHTWSLSVEEHFYLLWPICLAVTPSRLRMRIVGALLMVAGLWRFILVAGGSHAWVYYSTDANALALLAGSALALFGRSRGSVSRAPSAILLLLLCFVPQLAHRTAPYMWASFLVIGLTVWAIHQGTSSVAWLEWRPLRWFGEISYGLYLWHFLLLLTPGIVPWLAVALSVGLAWAMWRWVENPLLAWDRRRSERSVPKPSGNERSIPSAHSRKTTRERIEVAPGLFSASPQATASSRAGVDR